METKTNMENRVYADDSVQDTAEKIYRQFEVLQSVSIVGWIYSGGRTYKKGELVIQEIERLDSMENCVSDGKGKWRRKRVIPPNTIGGYVAHKMFRFQKVMIDNEPKITIWRIQ